MPILDKNDIVTKEKYIEFLKKNNASVMQDLRWSDVKNTWNSEAVYLEDNDEIIAAAQLLLTKLPYINSYLMYTPRGPICNLNDINIVNRLVKEAELLKDKYKIFAFKMDPEIISNDSVINTLIENKYKIVDDPYKVIQPIHNMILNLEDKDEESILKQFSEKTRYNIRVAIKKGIKVKYSKSIEDLKVFYELYKLTCIRDQIGCRAFEYFENMINSFNDGEVRIYIAYHESEPLAAAITTNYNSKMFYVYGASSNEKRNLMPNYLMQFEMIKWGLQTNCNSYDFGGVFKLDKSDGLYKFKSGFCKKEGVTTYIGEIDKVYNKFIYYIYSEIIPFLKSIKRKLKVKK